MDPITQLWQQCDWNLIVLHLYLLKKIVPFKTILDKTFLVVIISKHRSCLPTYPHYYRWPPNRSLIMRTFIGCVSEHNPSQDPLLPPSCVHIVTFIRPLHILMWGPFGAMRVGFIGRIYISVSAYKIQLDWINETIFFKVPKMNGIIGHELNPILTITWNGSNWLRIQFKCCSDESSLEVAQYGLETKSNLM